MKTEDFIDEQLKNELTQRLHHQINRLPERVRDRVREYIVSTQGKMLRPLLVVVSAKMLGATNEQLETAFISAVTVELLHNFTLIHDDILDKAPVRRGRDSYHIKHNLELALHDGDILHSYALSFVTDQKSLRLMMEISNLVGKGNGMELEYRLDNVFDFSVEQVIEVLRLKTAIVFYGCVALAGIATNKEILTEPLENIITDAGIAFQVQDDVLDILGEASKFGKQSYWDIQESKRNLFLYYALQTEHADRIKEIYSKPIGEKTIEDIRFTLSAFEMVKDSVIEIRDKYLENCLDRLDAKIVDVETNPDQRYLIKFYNFLRDLIIYICTREK
ncbi:MAG: polyprenyl synthetase family protein [Candidatus Hodarchaeales archaeon]|jgi:geranylgeranyl diphosphate synthase type II